MTKRSLTSAQREFLATVHAAAFANPFGANRAQLDLSIAGLSGDAEPAERLGTAIAHVNGFLAELDTPSRAILSEFSADDRRLVKHAELFSLFHHCIGHFDALITQQISVR